MSEKTKARKKKTSFCEDKSLVVTKDIAILLSYFEEKIFLNSMFKRI